MPNWLLHDNFKNHGNYVFSLANVTRWLGQQAEALGVEIFPGFPAAEVLYNDDGSVRGVETGNMGVGKDGQPTENFQLGMELHAKHTLFCATNSPPTPHRSKPRGSRPNSIARATSSSG